MHCRPFGDCLLSVQRNTSDCQTPAAISVIYRHAASTKRYTSAQSGSNTSLIWQNLTSGHKEVFRVQKFEPKQCKNTFNWKGPSVHKITIKQLWLIKECMTKAFPFILHLSICTISSLQQNLVNILRRMRLPHCLWHLTSSSEPTDWFVFNLTDRWWPILWCCQ